mgnify:CR=1 FL=1
MNNKEKYKVVHITSAHRAFDDRIFHKELKTLANAGYKVTLIAPHDKKEAIGNIEMVPIPKARNRFERMAISTLRALYLALKEKADIYHFHDPELIPAAFIIKLLTGRKVVYDVHEDYKQKMLSYEWINKRYRKFVSIILDMLEKKFSTYFDYVITADSYVQSRFRRRKVEIIANYPPLSFSAGLECTRNNTTFKLIYVGGISEDRGIVMIIESLKYLKNKNINFEVFGNTDNPMLLNLLNNTEKVKYFGVVPWQEVSKHLANADVGLVLLQPVPAYFYCPGENIVKLFEYMSVGLPIIISNFPKLKKLILDIGCGIPVDPTNPEEIAKAIEYLIEHPEEAKQMGENGRKAVLEKYNWEHEEKKLLRIYDELLNEN